MKILKKVMRNVALATVAGAIWIGAGGAAVFAADSWTFPVLYSETIRTTAKTPIGDKQGEYTSLESSEVTKKWHLCMLAPHMTNDILRAYLYATVKEAERLGAQLTTFDAGGYGNLDKQLTQFDNCVALGADAILIMAISPTAFGQKIKEARANGIKIVDLNIGVDTEVDARVVVTYVEVGRIIGEALAAQYPAGSDGTTVVVMPGPAGVAWSEDSATGFANAVEGSAVKIEGVVYGESGRLAQTPLVEDVLVTYQDLGHIVGMGTSLEAALNSLREQGRVGDIGLFGTFITPALIDPIKKDQVSGVVVENSLIINRLAVDMAVRLLEGKSTIIDAIPLVTMVDETNVDEFPANNFAPADWTPQLNVD